jgi:hypothetical protein
LIGSIAAFSSILASGVANPAFHSLIGPFSHAYFAAGDKMVLDISEYSLDPCVRKIAGNTLVQCSLTRTPEFGFSGVRV